jgi:hypothetical protein
MKPHDPKTRDKIRVKKKGETKGDKKPNRKRRKDNKILSHKNEKGRIKRKKIMTKSNKREGTEDQGSETRIASIHSILSNATSLVIL